MSSTKGVYFNGKLITQPGAYSMVDSTMTSTKSSTGAKVIALVGECSGGEPGVVQFFSEPSVAKSILKSGELLKACQKAWNPVTKTKEGLDLGGANVIACIRTNAALKGSSLINSSVASEAKIGGVVSSVNAGTTGVVTATGAFTGVKNSTIKIVVTSDGTQDAALCSYNWCLADETKYRLDASVLMPVGATVLIDGVSVTFGTGKYTSMDTFLIPCSVAIKATDIVYKFESADWGYDANRIQHKITDGTHSSTKKLTIYNGKSDTYETYDNLGGMFSIRYSGAAAYAALSIITDGNGNAIKLQTYVGTDSATAVVDLDINLDIKTFKSLKYFVTYMSGFENYNVTLYTSYNPELTVCDMDAVDKKSIKVSEPAVDVTGLLADITKTLKYQSSNLIGTAVSKSGTFANYGYTSLIGGSEGKTPISWVEFFDMLSRYRISYITPLTDDLSIIAECSDHVKNMSESMGKERRMTCGSANGLTVELAIANAMRFDYDRIQYVYPGFYDPDENGVTTLYPAYILAAQHAGRAAFLPDGESATHDTYNVSGIEKELEPDEISSLINSGVTTFEFIISDDSFSASSVRLVQDITTYTSSTDPLYVERAVGITSDQINKDVREQLDGLLTGKRTTTATLTTAKNYVLSILKQRVKDEIIVAYKDVNVYKQDGAVWVEYSVAPAEPTNFVLIKSHFYSENLTTDAAAS